MPRPARLLPWVLGYNDTIQQILDNQEKILFLLKSAGKGLSFEDRAVLERSISRLEDLADER